MQAVLLMGKRRRKGLILAAYADRMRVLLEERGDVVELRSQGGEWQTERGVRVEIEALARMPERIAVPVGSARAYSVRQFRLESRLPVAGMRVG